MLAEIAVRGVATVSDISLEHRKCDMFLQVQIGTDIISYTSSTDNGTVTHEVNGPQCKSRNNTNLHFLKNLRSSKIQVVWWLT